MMIIHTSFDERESIVEFTKEEHDSIMNFILAAEKAHDFNIETKYSSFNRYDNDDYLFMAYLINDISNKYCDAYADPTRRKWQEGYKAPPYIHVEIFEGQDCELEPDGIGVIYKDKKINMSVSGPLPNGCYCLNIDRYFLLRYIDFLRRIFDDNSEMTITIPGKGRFTIPLKKSIYNTSGFQRLFHTRTDLISDLYMLSFRAVVMHEFAHVMNGHGLLKKADAAYADQREIRICAEQNADDSAMRWLLAEPLYDGIDGNSHNYNLEHTRKRLKEIWAIRVFAFYLALSWQHRDDDRVWKEETLQSFKDDPKKIHPLYQFRLYNILRRAIILLSAITEREDCRSYKTSDGKPIDEALITETMREAMDYVNSLESCFDSAYGEEIRTVEQIMKDNLKGNNGSLQADVKRIPYAPPFFDKAAMEEICSIRDRWPELKARLEAVGHYSKLYETI